MKTYIVPLAASAALVFVTAFVKAEPAAPAPAPVVTTTDKPAATPAPVEGTKGQTNAAQPNAASPTGATRSMAPVRGKPNSSELKEAPKTDSASGLTAPGAASGSSLGSGSNSTLTPAKKGDEKSAAPKP